MQRKIIHIDQDKCNGCGLCAAACHEGAIAMRDGKACLARADYCDGLGDCLPACPTGAITFTVAQAPAYDAAAVAAARAAKAAQGATTPPQSATSAPKRAVPSRLAQWPAQIKLVPPRAPFFIGAHLLIAADCTAYAYGNFHAEYMRGRITLIGCPKLDGVDYTEKLAAILAQNDIRSVTLARMEVPCCGGMEWALKRALTLSGKDIPLQVVTVSTDGRIL